MSMCDDLPISTYLLVYKNFQNVGNESGLNDRYYVALFTAVVKVQKTAQ
jgi:hypothetical protein